MLKLKSSARKNRRYLLVEGKKEDIEKAILDFIGILGWAKADPMFVNSRGKLVLTVNRKEVENVRAALSLSDKKLQIKRVSGTLKGLEK